MTERTQYHSPFDDLVGLQIVQADGSRVLATLDVTPQLHQPTGLLHGGVYATMAETTASVGASLWLGPEGVAVGISNHTDFLRSVSEGRLSAEALPVQQGRTLQLWRVQITDVQDRTVAWSTVRLMNR